MVKWIALVYRLPPEPSAPRVATWRALKRLPGRYLVDGVYVVPHTPSHDLTLRQLAHDVRNYGGEALVLQVSAVDDEGALRPELPEPPAPAGPVLTGKKPPK